MRRATMIPLIALLCLLVAGTARADRKPTAKEKAQIASVVHLPVICARVRVSTVTRKPKWASVRWRRGAAQCDPLATDGVTVVKKTRGRWHFVTAGSSFGCGELYATVPVAIAKDLRIKCI